MRLAALLGALALMGIACGEGPRADADETPAGSGPADASAVAAASGDAVDSAAGPAPPPSPPEGRALRSYALRLVNGRDGAAVVYGGAGAREVVLDTVTAGDSVLLEVRLRTDSLVLRMADLRGETLESGVVRFPARPPADSVARWPAP